MRLHEVTCGCVLLLRARRYVPLRAITRRCCCWYMQLYAVTGGHMRRAVTCRYVPLRAAPAAVDMQLYAVTGGHMRRAVTCRYSCAHAVTYSYSTAATVT